MKAWMRWLGWAAPVAVMFVACGDSSDGGEGLTTATDSTSSASGGAGGASGQGGGLTVGPGSGGSGGGSNCEPPDMLIVLDRTMSMHRQPDGNPAVDTPQGLMLSKWYIAVDAIETVTAAEQGGIRFGLELFPRDPGAAMCVTLQQRISGTTATNPQCEVGEVLVSPKLDAATDIANGIDPFTTLLCRSTPVGAGLTTAKDTLAQIREATRDQYALLITDGQDTCDQQLPLSEVQAMAASGVNTYVVGFDGTGGTGVDTQQLNDLACAGRTAAGFPGNCIDDGSGNYSWDPNGQAIVYILAEDAMQLSAAFDSIAAQVCCDCID